MRTVNDWYTNCIGGQSEANHVDWTGLTGFSNFRLKPLKTHSEIKLKKVYILFYKLSGNVKVKLLILS